VRGLTGRARVTAVQEHGTGRAGPHPELLKAQTPLGRPRGVLPERPDCFVRLRAASSVSVAPRAAVGVRPGVAAGEGSHGRRVQLLPRGARLQDVGHVVQPVCGLEGLRARVRGRAVNTRA
jgi:hypothetical protein